ncbi:MAG: malectin domain-containing carbohydrate-binding protein [Firmicutes bacterium]|nr:malectin domain-containing carbohydrate-binding protein [Bacillota bacterium]
MIKTYRVFALILIYAALLMIIPSGVGAANDVSWEASLAYEKPVSIMKGTVNSKGALTGLVDGIVTGDDGTYIRLNSNSLSDERWTWFKVDLETVKEVNYFKLQTFRIYENSHDSYIKTIRIDGSKDDNDYETIIPHTSPDMGVAFPHSVFLEFKVDKKVAVRYVRVWVQLIAQEGDQMIVPALSEIGIYNIDETMGLDHGINEISSETPENIPHRGNEQTLDISGEPVMVSTGKGEVVTYPTPPCYLESRSFAVVAEGRRIPVIEYEDAGRTEYHYAHFSFSGTAQIRVTASQEISTYKIRPLSYGIEGEVDERNLTFTISQSRYLLININDMQNLIIITDNLETDVPPAIGNGIFNITSNQYNADRTGTQDVTGLFQKAIDDANAAPGGGVVYVPAGLYKISSFTMKGNVSLYLEGGAVIRGTGKQADYVRENPTSNSQSITTLINFREHDANMKIYGRGTLDCNGEELYVDGGDTDPAALRICGVRPNKNSFVTLDGVIISHGRTWTVAPQQSDNILITNLKVLNSENRNENDGIDINSCQDVLVYHCLTYTNDDSLCVKACNANSFKNMLKGPEEKAYNITFDDIVTYGRCAGTKMGMQGYTHTHNIWFKNIDVLKASRGIAFEHEQGMETMEGIHFININVEELAYRIYNPYPVQMKITAGGKIRDVEINNATFQTFGNGTSADGYNEKGSDILGQSPAAMIENVAFTNLSIAGKPILDADAGRFNVNDFTSNITFAATNIPVIATPFEDLKTVLWAKQYIEMLAAYELVSGVGNGKFEPNLTVKREEFAKMIVDAFGLEKTGVVTDLSDVEQGAWYYPYVAAAQKAGIVHGIGDNKFGIGGRITQQDMCVMIGRALDMADIRLPETVAAIPLDMENSVAEYAKDIIYSMQRAAFISDFGENKFAPKEYVTRAQAAHIIGKSYILFRYKREDRHQIIDMSPVTAIKINVGNEYPYTDASKNEYLSDRFHSGDTSTNLRDNTIIGTNEQLLYQAYRFGEKISYAIPAENGAYKVILRMMEPTFTDTGRRLFDISLEGVIVASKIDIFNEAGRHTAFDMEFTTTVTDGELNIELEASENNAILSAIEIVKQ